MGWREEEQARRQDEADARVEASAKGIRTNEYLPRETRQALIKMRKSVKDDVGLLLCVRAATEAVKEARANGVTDQNKVHELAIAAVQRKKEEKRQRKRDEEKRRLGLPAGGASPLRLGRDPESADIRFNG